MRKVLLSTVAALATAGLASGAFAQDEYLNVYDNEGTDADPVAGNVENVVSVDELAEKLGLDDDSGACNACDRLSGIESITDKAANAGHDFVNVQYRNDASGDIRVDPESGVLDQESFTVENDLEVSTSAMAGVQANKWRAANSGLDKMKNGQVPDKALNAQFRNVASADITSPDGIAEELSGTAGAGSARNVTISTNAMAGVQANIVEAGTAALSD
jgi:hypothetical protein